MLPDDERMVLVSARISAATLDRLDQHTMRMNDEHRGARFTRADIHRMLLIKALDDAESDAPKDDTQPEETT